jgi:hypothetical protein
MGATGQAGDLIAVGAGASPLSRSGLMRQTQNQGRIQSFMEMISAAADGASQSASPASAAGPVGAQVSVGRPSPPSPQRAAAQRAPTPTMLAPGQWGGRREGYQSAPEPPRTLFKPFTPPAPSAGSASQADGKPWAEGLGGNQQGVAPRASMGDNRHEESRAERTERHTQEAQAQAPNQEQIEDIAREVLDVLKHRWMIELERRGID